MAKSKQQVESRSNSHRKGEPIPFDEALRKLVNTPPLPKKKKEPKDDRKK